MNAMPSILLLESNPLNALTIRHAIEMLDRDHMVVHVSDCEQALLYLRRNGQTMPGLILMNMQMPHMTGAAFLDELRAQAHWMSVPVYLLARDRGRQALPPHRCPQVRGVVDLSDNYAQIAKDIQNVMRAWIESQVTAA